jgi:cell division FtsZ-interacting protein ZapD
MMRIRLIVEIDQQLLSDLMWKLYHRVKPSSLTSVIQQIESRKGNKTLRSAERVPIPLASLGDRLLSAA